MVMYSFASELLLRMRVVLFALYENDLDKLTDFAIVRVMSSIALSVQTLLFESAECVNFSLLKYFIMSFT